MNYHSTQEQSFTTLEDLRAYHNKCFIRLAYRTILGREADVEGLRHYSVLLQEELSPAEFLADLRFSQEAQLRWQGGQYRPIKSFLEDSAANETLPDLSVHAIDIYKKLKVAATRHIGGVC